MVMILNLECIGETEGIHISTGLHQSSTLKLFYPIMDKLTRHIQDDIP